MARSVMLSICLMASGVHEALRARPITVKAEAIAASGCGSLYRRFIGWVAGLFDFGFET